MDKGSRVRITKGRSGVGQTGVVFWVGPSKYGPGKRVGVKTDGGETVWTDDKSVELEGSAAPTATAPLFFGFSASDWHDEAHYTVAFVNEPDTEDLEQIAESLRTASIAFGYQNHFRWSGRLLSFAASARARGAVRKWVKALHPTVAIQDGVFHGARDGELEPGTPAAQPRSERWLLGIRPIDDTLPDWALHDGFEAAFQRVARRARLRVDGPALDEAIGKQEKSRKVRFERVEDASVPRVGDPRFDGFEVPASRTTLFEGNLHGSESQLSAGDHPVVDQTDAVALVVKHALPTGSLRSAFAWLEDGARHEVELPAGIDCTSVSLHPTERKALVCASGFVLEIDLDTGAHKVLPRSGEPVFAAYLAGGCAVTVGGSIVLFDAAHQPVDRPEGGGRWARVVAGGRGLIVSNEYKAVRVYALAHGKLLLEGELPSREAPVVCPSEGDPVLMLRGGPVVANGLLSRLAELEAKPSKRKSLAIELQQFVPLEALPGAPSDRGAPVDRANRWAWSPSGEWAAFMRPDDEWVHVLGPEGELSKVTYGPTRFAMTDDGRLITRTGINLQLHWNGPRTRLGWPSAKQSVARDAEVRMLPGLERALEVRRGGLFVMFRFREHAIAQVWQGRGIERIFEQDGSLGIHGPIGTFRVEPAP